MKKHLSLDVEKRIRSVSHTSSSPEQPSFLKKKQSLYGTEEGERQNPEEEIPRVQNKIPFKNDTAVNYTSFYGRGHESWVKFS